MKELIQEIQRPAYEFTDNPVPMDRVEYDNALGSLIEQTHRFAGVVAIYSLHREIYPGLSKMRFIYIVSDTVDEQALRKGLFPTMRKFTQENKLIGDIQVYNQTPFQHIDELNPMVHLKFEYGKEIRFAVLTGEDRNFAYILSMNDRILLSPLVDLLPMLVVGVIEVKKAWLGIESTIDLIGIYQKATGKTHPEWQQLTNKSHELGRNWFSMNLGRYQELKQLVRESVIILLAMLDEFTHFVQKEKLFFIQEGMVSPTSQQKILATTDYRSSLFTDTIRVLFIDNWSIELAFHKMVNLFEKTQGICIYLPTILSVPYVMYAKGLDLHATLVKDSLLVHGYSGNVSMPGVINSRGRWLSEYLQFSLKYKEELDSPAWFGYHIETPSKWTKWMENRKKSQHEKWQHTQSLELARI